MTALDAAKAMLDGVTRFRSDKGASVDPDGSFVLHRDYSALIAQVEQVTKERDEALADVARLTRWREEERDKILRQRKANADMQQACARLEAERDGLARKVAAIQRSGDELTHSELADLQVRVHRQREVLASQNAALAAANARVERMREALAYTAEQALSYEIPVGYGPEDKGAWTQGYDAAIGFARAAIKETTDER